MCFIALKVDIISVEIIIQFNRNHNVVTDGIMALRASNQVLCNVVIRFLSVTHTRETVNLYAIGVL